jgi:hypothetical protein
MLLSYFFSKNPQEVRVIVNVLYREGVIVDLRISLCLEIEHGIKKPLPEGSGL